MEERLFFIGLAMGGYAWVSQRFQRAGALDAPWKTGLWFSLFCALAAFSITVVLAMSLESRSRAPSLPVGPIAGFYPGLMIALVAAAIGFWRARGGAAQGPSRRDYYLGEAREWAETVFSAVLLAAVLMYFVIQAFKIPSGSMERTLLIGDHLFVNKFIYGLRVPFTGRRVVAFRPVERGDIVVFQFPTDHPQDIHCGSTQYKKDFIKRVVGLPGDRIEVREGAVLVNGQDRGTEPYAQYLDGPMRQPRSVRASQLETDRYQDLWQNHQLDRELQDVQRDYFGPITVPADAYFVMGDNRDRSCDSRYWGPVEGRYLKGRAWFIYWPPSRIGIVR